MKLLHQNGMISGFWAIEMDRLVPDIVDCSDIRHPYRGRVGPHFHRHWELYYQVAGIGHHYSMGGTIIFSWSFDSFIHSSDCAPLVSNYLQGELKAAPIERVALPRRFSLTPELNGNVKTQL